MVACSSAIRLYNRRVIILSLIYVVVLMAAVWLFKHRPPRGLLAYVVAVLPALPMVGIFGAIGRYLMEERDEYLRSLMTRQSLIATGFALSIATIWGFLEEFKLAPHVPAYQAAIIWFVGLGVGALVNHWLERGQA